MCNCIEQTTELIKDKYPGSEEVIIANQDLVSLKLFSPVEIREPGKKKLTKINLLYPYCPICGKKYQYGEGQADV